MYHALCFALKYVLYTMILLIQAFCLWWISVNFIVKHLIIYDGLGRVISTICLIIAFIIAIFNICLLVVLFVS